MVARTTLLKSHVAAQIVLRSGCDRKDLVRILDGIIIIIIIIIII